MIIDMSDYSTKRSKALDFYCNEKGMRRGMMTKQDHENFIEWLAEKYFELEYLKYGVIGKVAIK